MQKTISTTAATSRSYDPKLNLVANLRELVQSGSVLATCLLTPELIYQRVEALQREQQSQAAALILALVDVLECAQADMTGLIGEGFDGDLDSLDGARETYLDLCRITGEKSKFTEDEDCDESDDE